VCQCWHDHQELSFKTCNLLCKEFTLTYTTLSGETPSRGSILVQFVYDCLQQLDGSKMRKFCSKCSWKLVLCDNEEHMVRTILFQNVIVNMCLE
jgi:hypothetical protein